MPDSATVTEAVPGDAMRGAAMVVVNCPELTKVVVCEAPFQVMEVALVKPEPLTVSGKAPLPAVALLGRRLVIPSDSLMMNVNAGGEILPDSATVTEAVPGEAMRGAAMVVVNCPEFTNVVVCAAPFQVMEVALVKPEPLTVSRKAGPPATVLLGTRLLIPSD